MGAESCMFDDGSSGSHGMRANRNGAGHSMNFLDETTALLEYDTER